MQASNNTEPARNPGRGRKRMTLAERKTSKQIGLKDGLDETKEPLTRAKKNDVSEEKVIKVLQPRRGRKRQDMKSEKVARRQSPLPGEDTRSSTGSQPCQNQFIFQMKFVFGGKLARKRKKRVGFRKVDVLKRIFGALDWNSKFLSGPSQHVAQKHPVRPLNRSKEKSLNVSDEFFTGPEKVSKPRNLGKICNEVRKAADQPRPDVHVSKGKKRALKSRLDSKRSDERTSSQQPQKTPGRRNRRKKDESEGESYCPNVKMDTSLTRNTRGMRLRSQRINCAEETSESEVTTSDSEMTSSDSEMSTTDSETDRTDAEVTNTDLKKSPIDDDSGIHSSLDLSLNNGLGTIDQNMPLERKRKLQESQGSQKRLKRSSPKELLTKVAQTSEKENQNDQSTNSPPVECDDGVLLKWLPEIADPKHEEFDLDWETICDEALSLDEMLNEFRVDEASASSEKLDSNVQILDAGAPIQTSCEEDVSSDKMSQEESQVTKASLIPEATNPEAQISDADFSCLPKSSGNVSISKTLEKKSKVIITSLIPEALDPEVQISVSDLSRPSQCKEAVFVSSNETIEKDGQVKMTSLLDSAAQISDEGIASPTPQTLVQAFKLTRRFTVEKMLPCACAESEESGPQQVENGQADSSNQFCLECTVFRVIVSVHQLQMAKREDFYFCSLCTFKTSKEAFLQDHVAFTHQVIVYDCPHCDHQAEEGSALKSHYDEIHAD